MSAEEPIFPLPGGTTISCKTCSSPKVLYPPSTQYTEIILENCSRNDTKMGNFECTSCKELNEFYWHKKHNPESERFIPAVGD